MSNHKARFRGDIQVDGSIVGPDGQPIGGGGGSVDLTHLTELAFGEASDTLLSWHHAGALDISSPGGLGAIQFDGDQNSGLYRYDDTSEGGDIQLRLDMPFKAPAFHAGGEVGFVKSLLDDTGLHFGDFTGPADIHLEHYPWNPGLSLWGDSGAELIIGGAGGEDIYNYGAVDMWTGENQASFQPLAGDAYALIEANAVYGVILEMRQSVGLNMASRSILSSRREPESSMFELYANGDMHWGPGGVGIATDVSLERISGGSLRLSDESYLFARAGVWATDVGKEDFSDWYVGFDSNGFLATSPDGTAYKLTPPNGGGPATWVAA